MRLFHLVLLVYVTLIYRPALAQKDVATTYSLIDALLAGQYDGQFTGRELKQRGNFGIGTFHGLDGEMMLLDGVFYQIKSDGRVNILPDTVRIPWATVSFFEPEAPFTLPANLTYDAFPGLLDSRLPSLNLFYAIRLGGTFGSIKVRSVAAQKKPYQPMSSVIKTQSIFDYENVTGTLIGYRCPVYVKGVNVPGYHFHFLSADGRKGGHVLDFRLKEGTLHLDPLNAFQVILPNDPAFLKTDLTSDQSAVLKVVEKR